VIPKKLSLEVPKQEQATMQNKLGFAMMIIIYSYKLQYMYINLHSVLFIGGFVMQESYNWVPCCKQMIHKIPRHYCFTSVPKEKH